MSRTSWRSLALAAGVLCSFPALAQEKRFGAWKVGVIGGDEGAYAATTNDSGGVLGQYCYRERRTCVWLLANDIECKDGKKYSVLVNAESGAATTEILCVKLGGKTRFAFANFELIDNAVRKSEWIGFAFPLASGEFKVSRFPLDGAASAVTFLRKMMDEAVENVKGRTRDQTY